MTSKTADEPKKPLLGARIDDMMMDKRRLFLSTSVDSESMQDLIRKVWYLEERDPGKPILFIINSPGGSVSDGLALWDQLQMITSEVWTLVTGIAASMGSILSLAGAPGKRFATPYARFMVHQPSIHGVIKGQATDLEIQAKEIIKTRELLVSIYVEKTGKERKAIERALDRDTWMNPEEAKEFGHIDKIIHSFKEIGF